MVISIFLWLTIILNMFRISSSFSRRSVSQLRKLGWTSIDPRSAVSKMYIASYSSTPDLDSKRKIVFLGTPSVAAKCLEVLATKAESPSSPYQIVAVVTQPPAPAGRNKKITKSPVHELSLKLNLPTFTPELAKDETFLEAMKSSGVDLFITAAYGNYLPKKFLDIAPFGTINIHPSLLPKYRGAAPVQRCLENGDSETGVTLLYSVARMDAGPVLSQLKYPLNGDEKSTKVLEECFEIGVHNLIELLPAVFTGKATTTLQIDELATPAPKINATEGLLDFSSMTARQVHNKCRAFSEWPGTYAYFNVSGETQRLKIITTTVVETADVSKASKAEFLVSKGKVGNSDVLLVPCSDGSILGVLEIQPAGKKVMDSRSFINGMRGSFNIKWVSPPTELPQ